MALLDGQFGNCMWHGGGGSVEAWGQTGRLSLAIWSSKVGIVL